MSEAVKSADSARVKLYDIMQRETDFQDKAQAALTLGRDYLEVDNAHLTRINPDTDDWEIVTTTDSPEGAFPPGLSLDLETTYCRRVLEADSSIALHDAPAQGWADDPAFEAHDLKCYHGTQLTVDDEMYGTVCFVSASARSEPFSDAETLFAELIARLLEHELNHSRQVEETTRRSNSITVLSRVLQHNLRNEMTVVRGRVSMLANQLADQTDADVETAPLFRSIDRIINLSDKARKLEAVIVTQFERESIELDSLFDRVTTNITSQFPAADIAVEAGADLTILAAESLELALTELVENAAKHAGSTPEVHITMRSMPDGVELSIVDNGPGLPEQEQEVLKTGVETPLIHGSGLGLWMVYWIVTSHDGTIETTVSEEGTTVTVKLPQLPDNPAVNGQGVRALERGRDRFEAVFDESFNAMMILNDDRRIIDANKHATTLLGNDAENHLGRPIDEYVNQSFDLAAVWEDLQATGQTSGEAPIRGLDGSEHILEYRAVADIVPGQHLIVGQDITTRKERERSLEEIERRYRTLAENFPNGAVLVFDEDLRYQSANGEGFEQSELDSSAMVGKRIDEVFDGEHLVRLREMYEATLHGAEQETEMSFGERFYEIYTIPIRDDDGDIFAGLVISRDVTEREQRARELHDTTQRLDAVIQTSPNAILALDTDGIIQVWNEAAEDIFGYAREDVIGEELMSLDFMGDADKEVVRGRLQRALAGEVFTDIEVQRQTRTGEHLDLSLSSMPLSAPDGTTTGVMAVAEDITDRKSHERQLKRSNRQLRTILDTADCAIFLKDSDGTYQTMNSTGREVLGIDHDLDGTGLTDFDLFPEEIAKKYRADDQRVLESGDSIELEEKVPTEQGTRTYLTVKSPVFDEDGVPAGVCAVATDITVRKERERLERENERLEEFSGFLSHDLRNPLQVANSNLELARETRDSEELAAVGRAHDRMEELIEGLLTMARQDSAGMKSEEVDLSSLIESCWQNVETRDATLICEVSGTVEANRSGLAQLFENLIRNSVEHSGDFVTITVTPLADGFAVADDGPGLPDGITREALQPNVSSSTDGIGFGLKIVHAVVKAQGWEMSLTDSADGGARFEITGVDIEP